MTSTNQEHEEAVKKVRDKLQKSNAFIGGQVELDEQPGVDLRATNKEGKTYYFTIIKGTKQDSKSVYSAVSLYTWKFVQENHTKDLFFISEISEKGKLSYYIYTPTEMWHRTNTPYVHLKCNPLKNANTLIEFKDNIDITPSSNRYEGEKTMLKKLKGLPDILNKLQQIKG